MSGQWARPFRVTYPDGGQVLGAQFPTGICIVYDNFQLTGAVTFAELLERLRVPDDGVVEWADGGQP